MNFIHFIQSIISVDLGNGPSFCPIQGQLSHWVAQHLSQSVALPSGLSVKLGSATLKPKIKAQLNALIFGHFSMKISADDVKGQGES